MFDRLDDPTAVEARADRSVLFSPFAPPFHALPHCRCPLGLADPHMGTP